ncbi:alpha/beta fold hydrolase [Caulobacter sp. BP25]|uniref:alpha/beta fold hydrolase n=1 Tax=Caulobacter sp. BP25 TaxID=2048900 RepID=UPI000C12CAE5|nr:alpha/beta hydrolase [Caulobacter sp. BP25]PHY21392.1 hypothetical protein CSW59_03995 [Caulobacter sp. BP25]
METFEVEGRALHGQFLPGEGQGDTLIVLAHGWNATGAKMLSMSEEARRLEPTADQFIAELGSGLLSFAKPLQVAKRLAIDIACLDRAHGYSKIVIVGHSAGALVARAAWLRAAGARERGDIGRRLHPWADKVERIVLMAAINRGWSDSVAISPLQRLLFAALAVWEFFTYGLLQRWIGTTGYILEMRRGAPFITGLRLKWLAMAKHRKLPLVVQVLGTIDDIVSPKDNVDLIAGDDFIYLEAPQSGHASMIRLDEPVVGEERKRIFALALTGDSAALKRKDRADEVADNLSDGLDDFDEELADAADKREKVRRVVFVIHGIRDYGFWTKKIAGRAKKLGGGQTQCRTVTSSYGFFPMGPFVFKALRRRRVEWLMDQYVRARALYP